MYTPNEERLLGILRKRGGQPVDTITIVEEHYYKRRRPQFARESVVSALNHLADKVKNNREKFRIKKTQRSGPHPTQWRVAQI